MFKFQEEFKIKVIYKNGHAHHFWVTDFSFDGNRYKWISAKGVNRPIDFGGDEVAAVWQVASRVRPMWQ